MNPNIVTISVVGGQLNLNPSTVPLSLDEYVQWSVDQGSGICAATVDAASTPFAAGNGGPMQQYYGPGVAQVFPCPALAAVRKGRFKYSVSACVGTAANTKTLFAAGEWEVK